MTAPENLLALLRDATAKGQPALTLTDARVVELLGFAPDATWWRDHAPAIAATGWDAEPLADRGWVRFTRTSGDRAAEGPEPVDVRIVIAWSAGPATGPGLFRRQAADGRIRLGASLDLATDPDVEGAVVATTATAWVGGVRTELDLADENARRLAFSAALLTA